jgi:hypothetical protein
VLRATVFPHGAAHLRLLPRTKAFPLILQKNQDFFVPDDTSRALMPKC